MHYLKIFEIYRHIFKEEGKYFKKNVLAKPEKKALKKGLQPDKRKGRNDY